MQLPTPPLTGLGSASLFLDFDGTLVSLADTPASVKVHETLIQLLDRLQIQLDGRLALISGRGADEVVDLLRPLRPAIAGSHGVERIGATGQRHAPKATDGIPEAIGELRVLAQQQPGVLVEEKPFGVALHYRLAPHAEALCHDVATQAAVRLGLELQPGKMVIELKPAGADKGRALREFMAEAPFAGSRPLFIGDDLTDEHGFEAANDLGGAGILVGPARASAARYGLRDVEAVHRWLEQASEALR